MSKRLLLDTHVLLWALSSPAKLGAARREIERSAVYVSAASIWEIAIKSATGKLKADPQAILDELPEMGFDLLPITGIHAARTYDFGGMHKDTFDRMLLAQAMSESMTLLTNDAAFEGLPGVRMLT